MSDNTISANQATGGAGRSGGNALGGGLFNGLGSPTATIRDTNITANQATGGAAGSGGVAGDGVGDRRRLLASPGRRAG